MHKLDRAGANGLVLFNRFYQPDIDLETLEITPHLDLSMFWWFGPWFRLLRSQLG